MIDSEFQSLVTPPDEFQALTVFALLAIASFIVQHPGRAKCRACECLNVKSGTQLTRSQSNTIIICATLSCFPADRTLVIHSDVLEMRVFELSGIFETETKQAIKANVGRPDQNQRKELRFAGENADCEQNDRG